MCIQFLSLIGVTVQVLGAPRDLLHPELAKHTYFLHFCYRPCPFQQNGDLEFTVGCETVVGNWNQDALL